MNTHYRKKPVVIDAFCWDGQCDESKLPHWLNSEIHDGTAWVESDSLQIKTLEGTMLASLGDWVIRGIKGEIYPCKPDIFAATYESCQDE